MSKTGTFRHSAQQQSAQLLQQQLASLAEAHRKVHALAQQAATTQQSPEEIAQALLPLAQSMATLSGETRAALHALVKTGVQMQQTARQEARAATAAAQQAAERMHKAAVSSARVARAMQQVRKKDLLMTACCSALLPLAAVIWLAWRVGAL